MENEMTRTDIHRPSAIIPSEYEWVGFECVPSTGDALADVDAQLSERARIRAHMARTGGTYSRHAHGGNCMVCGNANAIYTVLFHHRPSNVYVRMGQDCAQKCDMGYDEGRWNAFRRNMDDARRNRAGKLKAERTLSDAGLTRAWEVYVANVAVPGHDEEIIIRDIVSKLIQYGSLSDKQFGFVRNLIRRIDTRTERLAARAAEQEAAAPLPAAGRVVIEGEVISTKVVDTDFGTFTKMLVRHVTGWKVWGTVPAALAGVQKGEKVRFTATLAPSNDDPKFGFFSRPSKAEFLPGGES